MPCHDFREKQGVVPLKTLEFLVLPVGDVAHHLDEQSAHEPFLLRVAEQGPYFRITPPYQQGKILVEYKVGPRF